MSLRKEEIWKKIKDYNYAVSTFGRIKNLKTKGILIPQDNRNGYLKVCLCKQGKVRQFYLHRLIAMTFLDNPLNLPQVNHIDENKKNNSITNLEWCTTKYNMNYGKLKNFHKKKVAKYENGFIKCIYNSLKEAANINKLSKSSISRCCNGLQKNYAGFTWKFI